jgi:hypothetical protein
MARQGRRRGRRQGRARVKAGQVEVKAGQSDGEDMAGLGRRQSRRKEKAPQGV